MTVDVARNLSCVISVLTFVHFSECIHPEDIPRWSHAVWHSKRQPTSEVSLYGGKSWLKTDPTDTASLDCLLLNSQASVYSVDFVHQDYLFDPDLLVEGQPPNDRGCRRCSKIGHIAKECPWGSQLVKKERDSRAFENDKRRQEGPATRESGGHNNHKNARELQQHRGQRKHIHYLMKKIWNGCSVNLCIQGLDASS